MKKKSFTFTFFIFAEDEKQYLHFHFLTFVFFFAGSLGVHYLRVQEERAQSGHEEVEQSLQHDRQANVQ